MSKKKPKYIIASADAETDPFLHGRVPKPFCWEHHSEYSTEVFWGDDCTEQYVAWLEREAEAGRFYLIYAHNGGKFDFHFLHKYLDNPIRVINSRIVHATLCGHIVRDSLAIIPVPLRRFFKGAKGDIDYRRLERHRREKHKEEILAYLHQDCVSLQAVVVPFNERFGNKLTVGSTAMGELQKRHDFEIMSPAQDAVFRPFYYGGRVECFKSGIIQGPVEMVDVNSEYPDAMKNYRHPKTAHFHELSRMPDNFETPFFMEFTGKNRGALPIKTEQDELRFDVEHGRFMACSHEIEAALEFGLIDIEQVHRVYLAQESMTFAQYVDDFYAEKVHGQLIGDEVLTMFSKFMLNSAYGKFGQSPDNFKDWYINRDFGNDATLMANGYMLEVEYDDFELWSRPAEVNKSAYYNVAIAASITSAARSTLLRGLQKATDPYYCDTDSIFCRKFNGETSDTELGAFKLEKVAPMLAVAGKKLYVAYDPAVLEHKPKIWNKEFKEWEPNPERKPMKISSKGGSLSMDEIISLCKGETVLYENQAPTFSLYRDTKFISRNFRSTAIDDPDLIL